MIDGASTIAPPMDVLGSDGSRTKQHPFASTAQRTAVLDGMKELDARSGAAEAFAMLRHVGVPIVAAINGSALPTRTLLQRARFADAVAHTVSTDEIALVAAHGWDINGAGTTGLIVADLSADPSPVKRPEVEGAALIACAQGPLAQ